ncbi:MAG: LysM peptidoglycan-binding domain-containing protein [Chloroflexi bacterium]|nr:LysM peptidoglycan-binding domain-containing protein [Chloroflexota bacterium]MQC27280.1 LysM peptidoglycan-binding domain-containing protein [Chloroflexota bacterium]
MHVKAARRQPLGVLIPLMFILTACSNSPNSVAQTPSASPVLTPYTTPTGAVTETQEAVEAPTSAVPESTATPFSHTIAAGETLVGLAERYGITLEALLAANPGVDARFLSVGLEINIPESDGSGVASDALATPSALPLDLTEPICYATTAGELWCFVLVENTQKALVDTVAGRVHLLDKDGVILSSAQAITPINAFEVGEAMPLVGYWQTPPAGWASAQGQLLSAYVAAEPQERYFASSVSNEETTIADNGRSAKLSGAVELPEGATPSLIWVLGIAYDAQGRVLGVRRWESDGDDKEFEFYVYSLGGEIVRVELLSEARP